MVQQVRMVAKYDDGGNQTIVDWGSDQANVWSIEIHIDGEWQVRADFYDRELALAAQQQGDYDIGEPTFMQRLETMDYEALRKKAISLYRQLNLANAKMEDAIEARDKYFTQGEEALDEAQTLRKELAALKKPPSNSGETFP